MTVLQNISFPLQNLKGDKKLPKEEIDALVAERIYKKPFTYEKAMSIITEGSGKHFDPMVVDAFCKISEKLYNERTKLNEDGKPA